MRKNGLVDLSIKEVIEKSKDNALIEERENYKQNKKLFANRIEEIKNSIPFPEVELGTTGGDYDEIDRLNYEKSINQSYWDRRTVWEKYKIARKPYIGRVDRIANSKIILSNHNMDLAGTDLTYYISDTLQTPSDNKPHIIFINADDREYQDVIYDWNFSNNSKNVRLSRKIMWGISGNIVEVNTTFDSTNEVLSGVSDDFLRNVLIRNKNNRSMGSIIQTIQEKQFNIRNLDANKSFIVQGCAGSGKTIVMLQRLRYLFYNDKKLANSNYAIVTPSKAFIEYIRKISLEFNINVDNIYSHKTYYSHLLGESSARITDKSEANLNPDFLQLVYSDEFLKDCFDEFMNFVAISMEDVVNICSIHEESLKSQMEPLELHISEMEKHMLSYINMEKDRIIRQYNAFVEKLDLFGVNKATDTLLEITTQFEKINSMCDELLILKQAAVKEYEEYLKNPMAESPEVLEIERLKEQINSVQEKLDKANVFTRLTYTRRKNELVAQCEKLEKIVEDAQKEDTDKKETLQKAVVKYSGYDFDLIKETNKSFLTRTEVYNKRVEQEKIALLKEKKKYEELNGEFSKKQNMRNSILNRANLIEDIDQCRSELKPITSGIRQLIMDMGAFYKSNKIESEISEQYIDGISSVFTATFYNYLKAKAAEYGYDKTYDYKFDLYCKTYFKYFMGGRLSKPDILVCIDEAQDLNPSEIKLIQKINECWLELYGDYNQVVTSNATTSWKQIDFIKDIFVLEENFRNTNEIISYCNTKLGMEMKRVGVPGSAVRETPLVDGIKTLSPRESYILIVKNESQKDQYMQYLKNNGITHFELYTVIESKGLEFYSVIVIDDNMTKNELYIACTRALSDLSVFTMK